MCEEFAKICGGGSRSRIIFSERRNNRCEANANQVLLYPVFFSLILCSFCFLVFIGFAVFIF
jgi:hypothetical protein